MLDGSTVSKGSKLLLKQTAEVGKQPFNNLSKFCQTFWFKPKVNFQLESNGYVIRTAQNRRDLISSLALRAEVYYQEWRGIQAPYWVDFEDLDLRADHILLEEKKTGLLVGTYRAIPSSFSNYFYSQGEFEIRDFLSLDGVKVEFGRACLKQGYRKGFALHNIWKGLGAYIKASKAQHLFGCASIKTLDIAQVTQVLNSLGGKYLESHLKITPVRDVKRLSQGQLSSVKSSQEVLKIPALLQSYLSAGARIYGRPFLDKEFSCFDVFTHLDLRQINEKYKKRFLEGC